MLKRMILVFIASACFAMVGCQSSSSTGIQKSDKKALSTGFNQESYIWESWMFPTNRTTGR